MKKMKKFLIMLIILISLAIMHYFFSYGTLTQRYYSSKVFLKIDVYDYFSNQPLGKIKFQLSMMTRTGETFSVSLFSGENGTALSILPINSSLELFISRISFSGIWILESIVSEKKYLIVDNKWKPINPEKIFCNNVTEYDVEKISFIREKYNSSTELLTLKIFLARGRLLNIFNPIKDALKIDPRLKINVLFLNFIEFEGSNLAIVPFREPLVLNASMIYADFSWKIDIAISPEESIDLAPIMVRSLSSFQSSSLREMICTLENYGFTFTNDLNNKVDQISSHYERAAQSLESRNYEEAIKNIYAGFRFYRDVYMEIISTYISVISWSPTLLAILILFSLSLSRLFTEKKILANFLFVSFLFVIFLAFLFTHQGLRFFIFGFHYILQKITIPSLTSFLTQFIQITLIIIVMITFFFTDLKDLFSQTFGISIRNLRRRRLKTLLALSALTLISASTVCLLTISPTNPIFYILVRNLEPKVRNGLIVYKQETIITKPSGMDESPSSITRYVTLQHHEISSFLKEYFTSVNIYGIKKVRFSKDPTAHNFDTFDIIVVDPKFTEDYLGAPEVVSKRWLSKDDKNMILVGSKIALKYNLTEGSTIFLDNRKFTIKSVFDEEKVAESLRDIDGSFFLFGICEPLEGRLLTETFIFGSIGDFALHEIEVYKVSLVLKDDYVNEITSICNNILSSGFDIWETETFVFTVGYLIHLISDGSVTLAFIGPKYLTFSGNWQIFIIPLIITFLILLINALGTIFERNSEIRVMFTIGASPLRIKLILIVEGMVLGVIGGIFGYITGYIGAHFTSVMLPSLIQENLISGIPFSISFFISILSSLIGYTLPSGIAIKTVVPSGVIKKRVSDVIEIKDREAVLEIPIRLQGKDVEAFDAFLERLSEEYNKSHIRAITLSKISFYSLMDVNVWRLLLNYSSYGGSGPYITFHLTITAKTGRDLKVIIKPLDSEQREMESWSNKHKHALKMLSPILRSDLLKFVASR